MNSLRLAIATCLVTLSPMVWGQIPDADPAQEAAAARQKEPHKGLEACARPMPALRTPLSFRSGEVLEYELDALGATAGKMTFTVQRAKDGLLPVQAQVQTNTFFSKVRRVKATAVSYLHPRTLRPARYTEDAVENEIERKVNVLFNAQTRGVKVDWVIQGRPGSREFSFDKEGLDVAGAVFLLRQLPFKEGLPVCFDVYGVRRMWRVTGTVQRREHVSMPLGEFEAWYVEGQAMRLDNPAARRELHVWISDDAQRLPLAAVGTIDLGTVRATLTSVLRPGEKPRRAEGKRDLKW